MQTKYANPSLKTTAPPTIPANAFKPDGLLHIDHFLTLFRSSLAEVFCRKGALKNFAKFTGKHLCQSLF